MASLGDLRQQPASVHIENTNRSLGDLRTHGQLGHRGVTRTAYITHCTVCKEMATDLKTELEKQKLVMQQLQQKLEQAELQHELECQKQQQEQWKATLEKLNQAKDEKEKMHAEHMAAIRATNITPDTANPQMDWLTKKLTEISGNTTSEEEIKKQKEQKQQATRALQELVEQQKQIAERAKELVQGLEITPEMHALLSATQIQDQPAKPAIDQQVLMEQLKASLATKNTPLSGDWQKDVLRQFLTNSNKTRMDEGATTLKPDLLKRLMNENEDFSMVEWLATLNKEEAGECFSDQGEEGKNSRVRSGMLDKATTNILHKEVWPQKNLMEDWTDEDIDFKNLQFEHHIAGEIRTIETCTEPAQILGRLKLLRRMAYAKLRGYDWPMIRKMYAAILRSIEAKEYNWSDNFDRFETILYSRRGTGKPQHNKQERDSHQKKWFCRDWNKPEGCTKTAPHKAWFGTGTSVVARTVVHICAACYMKDRASRDHPEHHNSCPHRNA